MLKLFKNQKSLVLLFLVSAILATFSSCRESKKIGSEIPADLEPVKLSTIMENPEAYNGKKVVVNGIITGQCASLCELFIRDGSHKATLFAEGFKFPKLEAGKPVSVIANVTTGPDRVVFSALGISVDKRKDI